MVGLKSLKIITYARYILQKSRGVFFSEVAEAPQAAAAQTHRAGRL